MDSPQRILDEAVAKCTNIAVLIGHQAIGVTQYAAGCDVLVESDELASDDA